MKNHEWIEWMEKLTVSLSKEQFKEDDISLIRIVEQSREIVIREIHKEDRVK